MAEPPGPIDPVGGDSCSSSGGRSLSASRSAHLSRLTFGCLSDMEQVSRARRRIARFVRTRRGYARTHDELRLLADVRAARAARARPAGAAGRGGGVRLRDDLRPLPPVALLAPALAVRVDRPRRGGGHDGARADGLA